MSKKLPPKQFFLLLYMLSAGSIVAAFIIPNELLLPTTSLVFYGVPYFILPFIIIITTFFVVVAIPKTRIALSRVKIPTKYSPKHFLLLLWLTAQAFLLSIALHGAIYALGILCFGWGFWGQGDEAVFFIIALFVVPAGVVVGAVGRVWEWAVTQPMEMMKTKGIQLPNTWHYFAPFGSYGWLWKFSKGIEAITDRRIRAARVFASVFFLGIIGFIIIRYSMCHRFGKA